MHCLVVGLDGSAPSAAALAWALTHLDEDGTIIAVHGESPGAAEVLSLGRDDRNRQRATLDTDLSGPWTAAARAGGAALTCELIDRDPAGALIQAASNHHADAIVVGTHGSSWPLPVGLGSVTRDLLHRTSAPLIVVPPDPAGSGTEVVVGVSSDDASRAAAGWAAGFAVRHGRELVLTHVLRRRPLFPFGELEETVTWYIDPELTDDLAEEDVQELAGQLRTSHESLRVTVDLSIGSPARSLVDRSTTAGLVVVGKQQSSPLVGSMVGPVLHHVLKRGHCPVAVIPSSADPMP